MRTIEDVSKSEKTETNIKKEKMEPSAPQPPTLLGELLRLVLKVVIIVLLFTLLFTFLFGVVRYRDDTMSPAIKEGDIVFFYRLDKRYVSKDTVMVEYNGEKQIRRVAAIAGDHVDITKEGLIINGALQQESDIYVDTKPYVEGISFPVTLKEGQVFLLGDNRLNAIDSRIYGPVEVKDTLGKVITVIRRRGI